MAYVKAYMSSIYDRKSQLRCSFVSMSCLSIASYTYTGYERIQSEQFTPGAIVGEGDGPEMRHGYAQDIIRENRSINTSPDPVQKVCLSVRRRNIYAYGVHPRRYVEYELPMM